MARNITVECYRAFGDDVKVYLKDLRPKQLEEYEAAFSGGSKRIVQKKPNNNMKNNNSKPGASKSNNNSNNKNKNNKPNNKQKKGNAQQRQGGGSGSGSGGGGSGGGDISVTQQQTDDGNRLTISNAAGDGRDININISMQASPDKRKRGGVEMNAGVDDDEAEDNPFTW